MTPFEEVLKRFLFRRDALEGFTARVLAAAREQESQQESSAVLSTLLQWFRSLRLVPALVMLALIVVGLVYRQHEREARGEAAKQQLLLAMQITNSKLHGAQLIIKEVEQ